MKKKYMHKDTGALGTQEEWLESYSAEELEARGLTATEAFGEDKWITLFEVRSRSDELSLALNGQEPCLPTGRQARSPAEGGRK